jgi:AcrR family transcriptional regulator
VSTRRYEQRLRAESAEATRRRILDTVAAQLREAPAQRVSIDAVARAAGVSRSTVYVIFESRTGLFDALARDLFERSGLDRLVAAVANPDAREQLRGGLRAGTAMLAAERDVLRALYGMARLDPEAVGDAIRTSEETRSRGMARIARMLDEQGQLRDDMTREQAAHVLWVLTSFEAYDLLARDRGLPEEAIVELLVSTAERAVCR